MECIQGRCLVGGIVIGRIEICKERQVAITYIRAEDVADEWKRYEQACNMAKEQLQDLYQKAVQSVGANEAVVFEAQKMILSDEEFHMAVRNWIENQHTNAEYAVDTAGKWYAKKLQQLNDEYMSERSQDIKDVSDRVLSILMDELSNSLVASRKEKPTWGTPERIVSEGAKGEARVIFAKEVTPGQILQLGKSNICAFVTTNGSKNSHAAIMARAMNIPAISGVEIQPEWNGKMVAVDGLNGKIFIEPNEQIIELLMMQSRAIEQRFEQLEGLKGKKTQTRYGKEIRLFANVAGEQDLSAVLENDAEGIGLFRTEFLFLNRKDYPTEEEQFLLYKKVAESMQGKPVVIRTLDIGADKTAEYMGLKQEDNPALGYRAIRMSLKHRDVFGQQLRAILRASIYGDVRILLPMIISEDEIRDTKILIAEAKRELQARGQLCQNVKLGVMIETPAAVMISKELAKEVDFFSIGTNDLTQYTLAIDRQNAELEPFYNPYHPAVLRMIEMVIANGHEAGIEVGICGELGSDIHMTKALVDMGIDELSVVPSKILQLRDEICQMR